MLDSLQLRALSRCGVRSGAWSGGEGSSSDTIRQLHLRKKR